MSVRQANRRRDADDGMEARLVRSERVKLIAGLLAVLLAAPLAANAQQPAKVARIGFLEPGNARDTTKALEVLREGLRELGYVEGKNLVIEYRSAENKYDRLADLASELVRLKVDVLVTYTTPGTLAAKRATATVPIVMASSGDAVASGLVASLARPGGNVTGSTFMSPVLFVKQLEVLEMIVPDLKRVASLVNPRNPSYATILKDAEEAAASKNIRLSKLEASQPGDLAAAFQAAVTKRVQAVIISADPVHLANHRAIADLAAKHRVVTIGRARFADEGGLIGFGTLPFSLLRRAPYFVDRILKGARPADLPIEQPTTFELVVNLRTAKTLGLTIPPSVLGRVNRVIE